MAPLDRDPSSATYYGLVKCRGRQIRQSPRIDNLTEARRKLRDFRGSVERVDPGAGRVTVEALLDRYLATRQAQEPGTLATKVRITVSDDGTVIGHRNLDEV